MPAGGSCLLGAMNLSEYYYDGSFDYIEFGKDVKIAVEFLNQILDEGQPLHPLQQQRDTVTKLRQIGLGFMGLGDLFIKAEVRYGSKESVELCEHIGSVMIYNALYSSVELAFDNGPFSTCNPDHIVNSKFYKTAVIGSEYITIDEKDKLTALIKQYGLRNSQLLTCAPTGTISTIFNVSGGIEPIFALKFTRTTKSIYDEDRTYEVYPNGVKYFLDKNGYSSLDKVEDFPDYLVTSRDIDWKGRIDVQAAWQKYIDASISATINLPESATVEDVEQLYIYAHDAGLKGTTVFRENCKRIGILYDSFKKKNENKPVDGTANIDNDTELIEFINGFYDDIVYKYKDKYAIFAPKENTLESLKMIKSIIDIEYALNHKSSSDEKEESPVSNIREMAEEMLDAAIEGTGLSKELVLGSDNTDALSFIETLIDITANTEKDIEGIDKVEEGVKAIKDLFTHNFSNILTRADFSSSLHGTTYYKRVACGHIYITVNRYQGRPVEVFMQSSKSGGCSANTEALGRMASTMLRAGIDPDIVVDSVMGVKCAACSSLKGKGEPIDGLSCSDVMARVIKEEYHKYKDGVYDDEIREWVKEQPRYEILKLIGIKNDQFKVNMDFDGCCGPDDPGEPGESGESINWTTQPDWDYTEHTDQENIDHYVCPTCGDTLLSSEGCLKCLNCGFSKC